MWRRRLAGQRRSKGQDGQSLLETAISMPLLLGLAFNIINWGYLWFMVLALSAAPRMGAQYATQGGAAGTGTAPGTTVVRDLVWENVTNAVRGDLGLLNVPTISVNPKKMTSARKHLQSSLKEGAATAGWLNDRSRREASTLYD